MKCTKCHTFTKNAYAGKCVRCKSFFCKDCIYKVNVYSNYREGAYRCLCKKGHGILCKDCRENDIKEENEKINCCTNCDNFFCDFGNCLFEKHDCKGYVKKGYVEKGYVEKGYVEKGYVEKEINCNIQ